ncbi:hypothetical protein SPHINGO8BC_250001 [Sphingobacterium multivorum]|uniref:Uncharacterized protein n=1 Tax=Sphingobacterium multivorum TaxID=28454 RepID=A0A654BDR9_SPHMU|nr:hypothetical protein SPHINGO8BC_250001 [Sphingobacterium multivorum]
MPAGHRPAAAPRTGRSRRHRQRQSRSNSPTTTGPAPRGRRSGRRRAWGAVRPSLAPLVPLGDHGAYVSSYCDRDAAGEHVPVGPRVSEAVDVACAATGNVAEHVRVRRVGGEEVDRATR